MKRRNLDRLFLSHVSFILVFTFLLQLTWVLPAFAQESVPQDIAEQDPSLVTVEIPAEEEELFQLFQDLKDIIMFLYVKDVDPATLYQGAVRGLFESLDDPYSQYFDKDQFASLSQAFEGEFSGIGVTIEVLNGNITVVGIFKDSPAERAGIKIGDIIIQVDGHDLRGKMPVDASRFLRGPEGTEVTVTVYRPSWRQNLVFTMERALITVHPVVTKDLGDGLYYIDVNEFSSTTGRDVTSVMDEVRSKGAEGIVLDLRGNSGGLLDAAIYVAGEFVPKGPIVQLRYKSRIEVLESDKDTVPIPTVVLVDNGTASASEIVAGAIRDRGKGVLVGEQTFGKGCVQALILLEKDMGGFRLTIAEYYTPAGTPISGIGLKPDIEAKQETVQIPKLVSYKRPLKKGVVGLDVLALQECLKFLGYDPGEADGVFGSKTESACMTFLKDIGHKHPGYMGEKETYALNNAVVDKGLNVSDTVLETGITTLKKWVDTGTWK